MRITWKVFGEISLYISIISGFSYLFSHKFALILVPAICAAGVAVMEMLSMAGHRRLRFIAIIIPAVLLILISDTISAMIIIPAFAYAEASIILGRRVPEYYSFRILYRNMMIIWGIAVSLILMFSYFWSMANSEDMRIDYVSLLLFGIIYLVCGSVVLRKQRVNSYLTLRAEIKETTSYLLTISGLAVCFAAAVMLFMFVMKQLAGLIVALVSILTFIPAETAKKIYTFFKEMITDKSYLEEMAERIDPEGVTAAPVPIYEVIEEQQKIERGFPWWLVVLIIVLLCAMLVVFLLKSEENILPSDEERIKDEHMGREAKVSMHRRDDNRAGIRKLYRRYLLHARSLGFSRRDYYTSKEVLDGTGKYTDADNAGKLRSLYLSARYDDSAEINDDMLGEAKKSLKGSFKK